MLKPTRVLTLAAGAALLPVSLAASLAAGPASAHTSPACTDSDLTASYHGSDAGMGHVYGFLVLTNTSGRVCHTGGYGGISYVGDGNGTQIGAPAVRVAGRVATYVLEPGQRLRSPLDQVTALNYPRDICHPQHVDGFRVYVPNSTRSQYVAHPTTGCRSDAVKLIHQKPLQRP